MALKRQFFFEISVGSLFIFEIHGKRLIFSKTSETEGTVKDTPVDVLKFVGIGSDGVRKFHDSEYVLSERTTKHDSEYVLSERTTKHVSGVKEKEIVSVPEKVKKFVRKSFPCFVICGTEFSEEMTIISPLGLFPKQAGSFYQSILSFAFAKLRFGKSDDPEFIAFSHTYLEWARRISFQVGLVHEQQAEKVGYFNLQVKAPDGYYSDIRIIPGTLSNSLMEPNKVSFKSLYRLEEERTFEPLVLLEGI